MSDRTPVRRRQTADHVDSVRASRIGCTVAELRAHDDRREAWCPGCRRWLDDVDAFASHSGRASGRQVRCRACRVEELARWRRRKVAA
jgi:hypothetical protein